MRVTQQDIARIAKVSQATVSRVLAGDTRVEPETRERVLGAMATSNYRPDVRAQSLRQKRTHLVGLVLKRPEGGIKDDPFFSCLVSEITTFLSQTKYHLCLDVAKDANAQTAIYDSLLRTRRVDGLILVEPECEDRRLQRLHEDKFPFVVLGNPLGAALHSIDNDNVLAARMATLHLLDNGFRSIGFLAGPKGVTVSDDRVTGYRMAMQERGEMDQVWHCDFGHHAAATKSIEILRQPIRPQAIISLDDFMATGVASAARQLDVKLPNDLAMVSFNDSSLCWLFEGGLTSVNMNFEQMMRTACERLIAIIEDGDSIEPSRVVISCELKVRGSSQRLNGGSLL